MNNDANQESERIDQDVTLSSVDLLACIIPAFSALFGCFYGLAIDDGSRGLARSPLFEPEFAPKEIMDILPGAVLAPDTKERPDRRPRWKVMRKKPPLTSASRQIKERVHDLTHICAARSSSRFSCGNPRPEQLPFFVRQVCVIARPCHEKVDAILRPFSYRLLGNAIKFSPAKTLIQIQVEADSEFVTLSVLDQGPGIPESDLENIFKDYWQAKETSQLGAGLGLPIVRGIVEEHGGRVWAERRDHGGTALKFTLPREA